jgi:hypothetical protein
MPDLQHALQGHDLNFLNHLAVLWGIEFAAPDAHAAISRLIPALCQPSLVYEIKEALSIEAQTALSALIEQEGRIPWAAFTRRFGDVRSLGPARRDRERPDLHPASPAEILWYRGLIGRAFFNLPPEPQEFAYIPSEFLEVLGQQKTKENAVLGQPASPQECSKQVIASDKILDQTCTLLAALRTGKDLQEIDTQGWVLPQKGLLWLLSSAGLLDESNQPHSEKTRAFLEAKRGEALLTLVNTWRSSVQFNELRLLSGLLFEGEWQNNPFQARQLVLSFLEQLPENTWWSLPAFVSSIHDLHPDFQRPAGDYDSWFIRRVADQQYLRGFSSWNEVDGALIRFLICGPLFALGIVDLASQTSEDVTPTAFRLSAWAKALLSSQLPQGLAEETAKARVSSEGIIHLGAGFPRAARYQIARFCQWEQPAKGDEYLYRFTPVALKLAEQQGLRVAHIVSLLRRQAAQLPPGLVQALERWEQNGVQAAIQPVILLRVTSPEVMAAIRKSPANRFLIEELNPMTAIVRPGAETRLADALIQNGFLSNSKLEK